MFGKLVVSLGMVFVVVLPPGSVGAGTQAIRTETSLEGLGPKSRRFVRPTKTAAGPRVASRVGHSISAAQRAALTRDVLREGAFSRETHEARLRSRRSLAHKSLEQECRDKGTLPGSPAAWLMHGVPFPDTHSRPAGVDSNRIERGLHKPILMDRNLISSLLMPRSALKSVGAFPSGPEGEFNNLEIEVSHSKHIFRLMAGSVFGKKKTLYRCRVGLGARGFPTPVGTYYVTHIYDRDPWWIPPENRAWAAGDSPSRRVYGGTMAPLLKKRSVRSRKKIKQTEDWIAGKVQLADYGYRFHGTNAPRSIGRNRSHGCVRMLPKDARVVAKLIMRVVGTVDRRESENGSFVVLAAPVVLNLVK